MESDKIKIFPGRGGKRLVERICLSLGIAAGKAETIQFSDGNLYVKIGDHVRDEEVYLVQPIAMNPNDEFVELLFWMDAFKRSGARYITAIIPYFGYAKGDKKDESRVSIRARVCAECIEQSGADRIIALDLHAAQIQGFFRKPVDHLSAHPLLARYVQSLGIEDAVVVAPDSGYAKNARKFAEYLNLPFAIGDKIRRDHSEEALIHELIGEVKDKNVIIIDDFSISGGTLVDLSKVLKEKGTKRIICCLSHIPLTPIGVAKINDSPIEQIISTDSIYNPNIQNHPKFHILSLAPLFGEVIRRMNERHSISELIDKIPDELYEACIRAGE